MESTEERTDSTSVRVSVPIGSFAERADVALAQVADNPAARMKLASSFFTTHPSEGIHDFGRSELAFMQWEVDRGCLNSLDDNDAPGSEWWRQVNGRLLRDTVEAQLLHDAGKRSDSGSESRASVRAWLEFIEQPSASSWYAAHNSSIVGGYLETTHLASKEIGLEQKLMNVVLYRVLFTQAVVEDEPWALGRLGRLLGPLVAPKSRMVRYVVHRRDFYPATYPLDADDRRNLERRLGHLQSWPASLIDIALIGTRLPALYRWAATRLDVPELHHLARHTMPCYPWGMKVAANELDAIAANDRPPLAASVVGRIVHGRRGERPRS